MNVVARADAATPPAAMAMREPEASLTSRVEGVAASRTLSAAKPRPCSDFRDSPLEPARGRAATEAGSTEPLPMVRAESEREQRSSREVIRAFFAKSTDTAA